MEHQHFQEKYQDYLKSTDLILRKNMRTYYKLVSCERIGRLTMISFPNIVTVTKLKQLIDENGTILKVEGPINFKFNGEVPEWYYSISHCIVTNVEVEQIGNYVRQYDPNELDLTGISPEDLDGIRDIGNQLGMNLFDK